MFLVSFVESFRTGKRARRLISLMITRRGYETKHQRQIMRASLMISDTAISSKDISVHHFPSSSLAASFFARFGCPRGIFILTIFPHRKKVYHKGKNCPFFSPIVYILWVFSPFFWGEKRSFGSGTLEGREPPTNRRAPSFIQGRS